MRIFCSARGRELRVHEGPGTVKVKGFWVLGIRRNGVRQESLSFTIVRKLSTELKFKMIGRLWLFRAK